MTTSIKSRPADTLRDYDDVIEGDCPTCKHGPWPLTDEGRVPQHDRRRPGKGHVNCVGAYRPAVNTRVRPYVFVEGVVFL